MRHLLLFITLLLAIFSFCNATVLVDTRDNGTIEYLSYTIHFYNQSAEAYIQFFDVNDTEIVNYDESTNVDVNGKIALIKFASGADTVAIELRQKGAVGMIMGSSYASPIGRPSWQFSQSYKEHVDFPATQVTEEHYNEILKLVQDGKVNWVKLESEVPEDNPLYDPYTYFGRFSQIFLGIFFGLSILACIYLFFTEMMRMHSHNDFRITLRVIIIVMVFVASVVRFLYGAIDPYGSQRTLGWAFILCIHLFNVPLTIVIELLLSLFWLETSTAVQGDQILGWTKYPFMVMIIVFVLIIIITAVVQFVDPILLVNVLIVLGGAYILIWVILAIFHFVVAILMFNKIKSFQGKLSKKKANQEFLYKVFGVLVVDFAFIVVCMVQVASNEGSPWEGVILSFLIIFLTGVHSIVILSIFKWNLTKKSWSNKTSRTKKTATVSSSHKDNQDSSTYQSTDESS